jgi:hypothetical protein
MFMYTTKLEVMTSEAAVSGPVYDGIQIHGTFFPHR